MSIKDFDACDVLPVFQDLLPTAYVDELVKQTKKRFYQRIFTPVMLLWCLIYQRLSEDHTQDNVVSFVKSGAVDHLRPDVQMPISQQIESESTAAYSNGRHRFPLEILQNALPHTARAIQDSVSSWHGHQVSLIDGSIFLVRPTDSLIEKYGRQHNQHGTNYWIQIRSVATFCLRSGVVTAFAEGPVTTSEQTLALEVFEQAAANTVHVGDENFGVFSVAQGARHYSQHVVFRLTQKRANKIAKCVVRPGDDITVKWKPSRHDKLNDGMSEKAIRGRVLCVRIQLDTGLYEDIFLFTTLIDRTVYTPEELIALYGFRWHAELNLKYIKTQLGMRVLTSKSPDMVLKEMFSGLLAYNLLRACMLEAAKESDISPFHLSFTKCWRRVRHVFLKIRATDPPEQIQDAVRDVFSRLRKCKLPQREIQRFEPRKVRYLPKSYPALKGDREEARKKYIKELRYEKTKKAAIM